MIRRMKKTHLAVMVVGLGLMAWMLSGSSETQDAKLILDRPWVSEIPKDPREAFHALFLAKKGDKGATLVGSRYQHLVSVVSYKLDKDKLQLNFLQQEFKLAGKVKAFKCKAEGELDLCLEIDYRWKKVRLYSSTKWSRAKDVPPFLRFDEEALPEVHECVECREGEPSWLTSME
jgi:hypothetical protein